MKGVSILLNVAALFAFVQEGDCRGWGDYFSRLPQRPRNREGGSKRIIGGSETSPGQFPWMVAIAWAPYWTTKAGASLVTCRHALSAASMFHLLGKCGKPRQCLAVVGGFELSKDGSMIRWVAEVIIHEDFDWKELKNDIAVVRFDKRVAFGPTVSPVCLAPPGISYEGKTAIATGWGKTGSVENDKLFQVSLPILPRQSCLFEYGVGKICAGYSDQRKRLCWGDSGDPLVVRDEGGEWVLVGIASEYRPKNGGCTTSPGKPVTFTDVGYFNDWILPRIDRSCDEDWQQPHF